MILEFEIWWAVAYLIAGISLAEITYRWTKRNNKPQTRPAGSYVSAVFLWGFLLPIAVLVVLFAREPKK